MTAFQRVYLSTNRTEWWNGHLAAALARTVQVVPCSLARPNQPGHPVETDINQLIRPADGPGAFYLGSLDQMFAGITGLPVLTAIWTDYCTNGNFGRECLPLFDVVFCSQQDSVAELRQAGIAQVEWLPFAFDATLANHPEAAKIYDIGFVGSLEQPKTRAERIAILGRLERLYRLNDYRQPVFGDAMMGIYNQSRIVVNMPVQGGVNMRTFEAMASGALLLTKRVGNGQEDLFKDGTHLVTYDGMDDLMDKVVYYLGHEEERTALAAAGRREVLAHHTYDHRAARVLEVMGGASRGRSHDPATQAAAYGVYYDYLGRSDLLGGLALAPGVPLAKRLRLAARAGVKFLRQVSGRRAGPAS